MVKKIDNIVFKKAKTILNSLIGHEDTLTINIKNFFDNIKKLPDTIDSDGNNLLLLASEYNNSALASYLIDKGIDVNSEDNKGETALFHVNFLNESASNIYILHYF